MAELEKSCCCTDDKIMEELEPIIAEYKDQPGGLIPVLHAVQRKTGYLCDEVLTKVADQMDIPLSKVYGVATFYSLFTVKPKGKYIIRVCESAPCHIVGAQDVYKALEEQLGITAGENSEDGLFTLEFASCLGVCGVAPAIMINDEVYGNLTPEMIPGILAKYRE